MCVQCFRFSRLTLTSAGTQCSGLPWARWASCSASSFGAWLQMRQRKKQRVIRKHLLNLKNFLELKSGNCPGDTLL
jgi:hypothetical protein